MRIYLNRKDSKHVDMSGILLRKHALRNTMRLVVIVFSSIMGIMILFSPFAYAGYLKWTNEGGPFGGSINNILIDTNDNKIIYM